MLESLFNDLEKYLDVKPIKQKDEEGSYYKLSISDQDELKVRHIKEDWFMIFQPVTNFPSTNQHELNAHLLEACFLFQGTGGALLSIDPNEKQIFLSLRISYDINYKIFRDKIEDFLKILRKFLVREV